MDSISIHGVLGDTRLYFNFIPFERRLDNLKPADYFFQRGHENYKWQKS